ncbi:MAG: DUF1622 domain-containing protein [Ruminococcaceae bacterium]|nr:DUF1622 domain-containing protein [Oscillospiraceae bacterium]
MPEHAISPILEILIPICELMGITVVAISTLSAFGRYIRMLVTREVSDIKFRLASGLALSLEFKMAAEILKTVQVRSFEELTVLGIVIALRALLSFLIHFEMKYKE